MPELAVIGHAAPIVVADAPLGTDRFAAGVARQGRDGRVIALQQIALGLHEFVLNVPEAAHAKVDRVILEIAVVVVLGGGARTTTGAVVVVTAVRRPARTDLRLLRIVE